MKPQSLIVRSKKQVCILSLFAVSAFSISGFADGPRQPQDKPNVIYILADDAGIGNFGCYGGKIIKTPDVDKLCKEGMMFARHYSGSTICLPSRNVQMLGKHTGHLRPRIKGVDVTVAEVLKKAGYKTACVGKWGLGEAGTGGRQSALLALAVA